MNGKAFSIFLGFGTTLLLIACATLISKNYILKKPTDEIGIVISAKNSVVLKPGAPTWVNLKKGDLIYNDDTLQGGQKAYLAIQWLGYGETEFHKSFLTKAYKNSSNKLALAWKKGAIPKSSPVEIIASKKRELPSYVEFTPSEPRTLGLATPNQFQSERLSNQQITEVVKSDYVRLRACLANNIRQSGVSEGKAVMHLNILPSGDTKDIYLKNSDFENRSMNECLLTFFKRLKFPSFDGQPIEVNYPVIFE